MFQPIGMDHVIVPTYSMNVSWSCDKSWLSVHFMWSISQSHDDKDRKLKAIIYSVRDSDHFESLTVIFFAGLCTWTWVLKALQWIREPTAASSLSQTTEQWLMQWILLICKWVAGQVGLLVRRSVRKWIVVKERDWEQWDGDVDLRGWEWANARMSPEDENPTECTLYWSACSPQTLLALLNSSMRPVILGGRITKQWMSKAKEVVDEGSKGSSRWEKQGEQYMSNTKGGSGWGIWEQVGDEWGEELLALWWGGVLHASMVAEIIQLYHLHLPTCDTECLSQITHSHSGV